MRAIGTQIDPNVLGGFLILMASFTAPQLVSPRPLLPRAWVAIFLALEALALYLTHSRGSSGRTGSRHFGAWSVALPAVDLA